MGYWIEVDHDGENGWPGPSANAVFDRDVEDEARRALGPLEREVESEFDAGRPS